MATDLFRSENARLELDVGVATLTMPRPTRRNAMSPSLIDDLHSCLDALARSRKARVVIPTGAINGATTGGGLARAPADEICANTAYAVSSTKHVLGLNIDAALLRSAIELENRTQVLGAHAASIRDPMRNWKGVAVRR